MKLFSDQNQCFQVSKSETKLKESPLLKVVGHIDWTGNMQPIIDIGYQIGPVDS